MGNWRTVNIAGTMTGRDAAALRQHLGYSFRDPSGSPGWEHFGPLSFDRDQPSLCGLNDWPAPQVSRAGNLAERNYDVDAVAAQLRQLVNIAPSMLLKVHCGGDYESLECVATISVGEGLVAVGKPEVTQLAEIGAAQMAVNLMRAMNGGS